MKTLLLTAALLTATGAVAASADELAPANAPTQRAPTQRAPTQRETGDLVLAQKAIEEAVASAQTDEEKAEVLLRFGTIFDNQEFYEAARITYQRALPLVADSPEDLATVRLYIATTYVNQQQWQSAADSWAQLMESAGSMEMKATYQLALAQAYTELKQTAQAQRQLESLRLIMAPIIASKTAAPDSRGFALILVGRSYQTQDDLDAARKHFEAAAQLGDASNELRANALKSLAEVAQKQGRKEQAQSAFADARQLLMNVASEQFAAKAWAEAAALYREAAQLGTLDAVSALSIRWQLGNALREMGDIDGARAEFQGVIAMASDASNPMYSSLSKIFVPFSYYYLAQGYIAQGKFELARAALTAELALPDLQAGVRGQAEALLKELPT